MSDLIVLLKAFFASFGVGVLINILLNIFRARPL